MGGGGKKERRKERISSQERKKKELCFPFSLMVLWSVVAGRDLPCQSIQMFEVTGSWFPPNSNPPNSERWPMVSVARIRKSHTHSLQLNFQVDPGAWRHYPGDSHHRQGLPPSSPPSSPSPNLQRSKEQSLGVGECLHWASVFFVGKMEMITYT